MNRERAKELLPVHKHFADGGEIQKKVLGRWFDTELSWDGGTEYRIKPKEPQEFWVVPPLTRSDKYPHVLSLSEKEQYFADSNRYIKMREVIE